MADPKRGRHESRPGSGPAIDRPRAVVCDEGELDDVFELLCDLDPAPLRLRPEDLDELREWERPSRLLLTSVRVALRRALPLPNAPEGSIAIAVADGNAQSACATMLRRGFRYVVRRPVHPEALRLLLMQVLWQGRDHRLVARFPFGGEVAWRSGLRRGRCTMVEISAHGCRLVCREPFRLGERVRLRVSAALTGSRDLRLRGRIVRRDRLAEADGADPQIAVQFDGLSARSLAHLDALLAERASGPAMMAESGQPPAPGVSPAPRRGRSRFPSLTMQAQVESASPPSPGAPEVERRRRPRGVWQREVVALDGETDRALHTLLGSDLSVGGLRVEPHPLLRIGDRLRLALYDAGAVDPLIVEARVAHDGGRRGVGLVFVHPSDEARARLHRMVAELPPLSALSADGEKEDALVMGEIVSLQPTGPEPDSAPDHQEREPQHDHGAADHDDEEA